MLNEILADSETAPVPADNAIKRIADLAAAQARLERLIISAEEDLAALKEELRDVAERSLPDAMAEAGIASFTLEDGSKITVKPFYGASITDENRAGCFGWLEETGNGSLIKKEIGVAVERGDAETFQAVTTELGQMGLSYKVKEAIHPQTLQAFIKEQVEGGKDFPMDLFKVYTGRKAKIQGVK